MIDRSVSTLITLTGHTGTVYSCRFSPDGKRIVSASRDDSVRVWDAETGKEQQALIGHTDPVRSCAFSPDGKRIVSASDDNTVKVWNAETLKPPENNKSKPATRTGWNPLHFLRA